MYLSVRLTEVPVSSQESEQSCICVLGLVKCLYQARKVSSHVVCVLGLVKCLYQARKVSGHVVGAVSEVLVTSQESERSCR